MRIRYSILRTVVISAVAIFFIGLIVTLYAVAPELHRLARTKTQSYLENRFQSSVRFKDFEVSVYPSVHVVVNEIEMRHQGRTDIPPLIEIKALTMDAKFWNLLSAHPTVSRVDLKGLVIHTPPRHPGGEPVIHGSDADLSKKFPVTISTITADEALIVILRTDAKTPHEFEIHKLEMNDFDFNGPASFHAFLTNPVPRGEIRCVGQFGPWDARDPSQTAVKANYEFYNADMGTLKGLQGTLSSTGKFSGPLDYLTVNGVTDIPNFALRTSDHPMALHTDFEAVVDGTNGNTYLNVVTAKFLHTTLVTKGKVVDEYPTVKGRTIVMDTVSKSARIEDMLFLAVKANPPVMTGDASLKAKILIPEGDSDLIERLRIAADFGVSKAEFTSDSVQGKINSLSRRGQGQPKNMDLTTASDLRGAFEMASGDIRFSRLAFSVPGADIQMAGTYSVDSAQLNFRGKLELQAKLSQTVTGVKSFFLKAVDPFFKGKNGDKAGTVIPIKVIGTKDHPSFGSDFHDKLNKFTEKSPEKSAQE